MANSTDNRLIEGLLRAFVLAAVLSALWWLGWTLLLWWRWHPQLPWRDLFVVLNGVRPLLEDGTAAGWLTFLVEPHYAAHRIALPRLLVAADLAFFGAHNQLLYLAGFSGLLVMWLLPLRLARAVLHEQPALYWFFAGSSGLLLFAPANFWNIANAINSAWHLSLAFAVLALAVLATAPAAPSLRRWLLAYLLATLSAFSTFAGVILWLLLPLFALVAGRRSLLLAILASGLLTALYLQGIASDAGVASRWQSGDADAVSQMRQVGEAALAANTPLHIAHKAAIVLGWPLAADRPSTAVSLVLLSLLVPVLAALQFGRNLVAGRGLPGPWLQFCLLLSALTVGTALAIQLGRVIEQPNYAHGPSYERYATIAALYWCSLFGLMLAWLSRQPAVAQACGLGLLLALGWVLATPAGDYLKQEIDSLQVAGRLYAAGETPSLRGRSGNNPSRFKPEYIFSFDDLFRARGAAYTRPTRFPAVDEQAPDCRATGVSLSAARGKRAKRLHLTATVTNSSFFLVRDILVADRGQLVARLVPHNQGDAVAVQLLARDDTAWEGRADIPRSLPPSLQLILTLPAGLQLSCQMPTEGLVPAPATVETMTDV